MPERLVPAIDIGPFEHGSAGEKRSIAARVDAACREIGFLVITGHGIPKAFFDDAFAAGRAFFDLPEAEKRRTISPGGLEFLGYTAPLTRNLAATLGEERPPDLREIFTVGAGEHFASDFAGLPGVDDLYAPNRWPDRPDGFEAVHLRLYRAMEILSARMMRIFALSLGLPEDYFADKIDRHFSPLGSFHYPALTAPARPGQLRCGAHTDFGSLTMLAMDAVVGEGASGGLQVQTPNGDWEDVTAGPDELVLNIGDMMARWTNDHWTSTLHRVAVPDADNGGRRRQSIGYFLHPNYDAEVRCLETCTSPDDPPRYPTVTAGAEMYKKLTSRIDGEKPQ
jgi:isopenicillin N synthase-like dioxygenase